MIPVTGFAGKTVAVFGLGGSGLATARALAAGGAQGGRLGRQRRPRWQGRRDRASRSPTWRRPTGAVRRPDAVARRAADPSRAALDGGEGARRPASRSSATSSSSAASGRATRRTRPFVAITGTNGKSTTTALIGHILRAGRPRRADGRQHRHGDPVAGAARGRARPRVECSSFQIDLRPRSRPTVGVLLNISPDHLDRHGDMENYAAIKERLVAGGDIAVIGVDDDLVPRHRDRLAAPTAGPSSRISVERRCQGGLYAEGAARRRAPAAGASVVADLAGIGSLRGAHNCPERCRRLSPPRVRSASRRRRSGAGLRSFPGLAHRMEQVGRIGRTLFINDSKATNADAAGRRSPPSRDDPLDRRRRAEGGRHRRRSRRYFPRSPRPT